LPKSQSKKIRKKRRNNKSKKQDLKHSIDACKDVLEGIIEPIEKLLGFSGIDREKLYTLYVKNEKNDKKTVHRVFRNRVYYRKYFAIRDTANTKEEQINEQMPLC